MIRRVKIQGYKSLKDIEVELQPLTVIIGPNAAGKSNLFDALGLLSRMMSSSTLIEAFKEHRGTPLEAFTFGKQGLSGFQAKKSLEFSFEVDLEPSNSVFDNFASSLPILRYALTILMEVDSGHIRVNSEKLIALPTKTLFRITPDDLITSMGIARVDRPMLALQETRDLDPYIVAAHKEISTWRFYYLDPATMRKESLLKEVLEVGPLGSDLAAFYNTLKIKYPRRFEAINRIIPLLLPSIDRLDVERTSEGFLRLIVYENGVPFSARLISEGTLRILGLLAIINSSAPATVVGYEEPENGVHPRRLELIAELLKNAADEGKQILINTHSPQLPEYFDPASLMLCTKEQGQTTFERFSLGKLDDPVEIEAALEGTPFGERVLRGDFGD